MKRFLEAAFLQRLADRLGLRFWEKFLVWRHDFSTRDKMRRVFARREDPFDYDRSEYERQRYETMYSFLRDRSYEKALEAGCAEGVFTRRLVALCGEVVAVDISARAVKRAKAKANDPKVRWVTANIRRWRTAERFDLVVLGDMVYYLGAPQKGPSFEKACESFCAQVRAWLRPGGRVLLANGFGNDAELARNEDYALRLERRGLRRLRQTVAGKGVQDKRSLLCSVHLFEAPAGGGA